MRRAALAALVLAGCGTLAYAAGSTRATEAAAEPRLASGVAPAAPGVPRLRIETGRHGAFIHALALDEAAGRLYSASEDETVRVWRRSDGRLLDTWRVPGGRGADGQLYALALSPDGTQLAVGGWTCWDAARRACIYLFDAATGAITGRITGLDEVVAALRYAPDGRHLAVGLMGAQGLRVYRVADGTLVAADRDYRDKLLELDFARSGTLVTGALDGYLRLYDAQFALRGRVRDGLAGQQPFGLRWSPDGRHVAVGFNDVASVSVLNADLSPAITLTLSGVQGVRNLTRVAWAANGEALTAAGEPVAAGRAGLYRWSLATPGISVALNAPGGRIGDLLVDRRGYTWFATDDPALALLDPQGALQWRLEPGVPRWRGLGDALRVAHDGSEVEFALAARSGARRRYAVATGTLTPVADAAPPLAAPGVAPAIAIAGLNEADGLAIGGRRVALEPYEIARAAAMLPDGRHVAVGTEWALRLYDAAGRAGWSVRTATRVEALAASGDGRYLIAALADGTLNWYRASDGATWLSLFVHANGVHWAAWLPTGEYASSPYGDGYVGWQVDRGAARQPDFFRAVQFERELYRPELIRRRLAERGPTTGDARRLLALAPPRLALSLLQTAPGAPRRVRLSAERVGPAMLDAALYLNDVPLTPAAERTLAAGEHERFVRDYVLPIDARDATVRAEVRTDRSLGMAERVLPPLAAPPATPPGELYVLAVGSNRFPDLGDETSLSYAAADAAAFARALTAAATPVYRAVHLRVLNDDGELPLRATVRAALADLSRARGEDTVVVFMASHGISDGAGNYYFVPRDARRADVDAVLDDRTPAHDSLLGWRPIFDALRGVAGRRVLIVDTCHARRVAGRFADYALVKRSAASRIAFVLASSGDEESQEYPPGGHGLFTYALLEQLQGRAAARAPASATLAQWFDAAADRVDELRDRRIGAQTPQFLAPPSLAGASLLAPH